MWSGAAKPDDCNEGGAAPAGADAACVKIAGPARAASSACGVAALVNRKRNSIHLMHDPSIARAEEATRTALADVAETDPQSAAPWLALARAAESAGDLARALDHFEEASRRDTGHAAELLRIGRALQAQGAAPLAAEAFRRAADASRASTAFWSQLAARLTGAGRHFEAGVAIERALALAPDQGDLHGQAGDLLRAMGRLDASIGAYTIALRWDPASPSLLNKLACAQRELGNRQAAEATFRQALAIAPAFMLARMNLVTLHIDNGKLATARAELRQAIALAELADDDRREAELRLAILDEHDALAPAIAAAVATGSDAPILAAVAQVADVAQGYDGVILQKLWNLARRIHESAGDDHRFPRGDVAWSGWPAFEAHFALHMGDHPARIAETLKLLASDADGALAAKVRAARQFARGVELRHALPPAGVQGFAQEARLRFWHAFLTSTQPEVFPGQVKPTPNVVELNPTSPRSAPAAVAGTWRRFFSGAYLRAPAGPWRAALLYVALVEIHGFADGNGRVARFLVNLELEQRGYRPLVLSDAISKSVAATLVAVRVLGDIEPLVDLFASAAMSTTTLLRVLVPASDA
jgi:tetratricopeptide (TPR) repeat protein